MRKEMQWVWEAVARKGWWLCSGESSCLMLGGLEGGLGLLLFLPTALIAVGE